MNASFRTLVHLITPPEKICIWRLVKRNMELLPVVWGCLAILDTFGCLGYRLVQLIWGKLVPNNVKVTPRSQYIQGFLGKFIPYSVKQIYFQQVKPRSQYIQGFLRKRFPNSVKQIEQVEPRSQDIQECPDKLVPSNAKEIILSTVTPRSHNIQDSVCSVFQKSNEMKLSMVTPQSQDIQESVWSVFQKSNEMKLSMVTPRSQDIQESVWSVFQKSNEMKLPMVTPQSQDIQESVWSVFQKLKWSKAIRIYIKVHGNDMNCHKDFLKSLGFSSNDAVTSVDQSDVLIAFVTIVSRIQTDIEAALKHIPEHRRTVLVLLHHTYDPDMIIRESRHTVGRSNIFAVDCFFHEDQGLLKCPRNKKALEATAKYLQDIENNYQFI